MDQTTFKNMDVSACCAMMAEWMNAGRADEAAKASGFKDCGRMMKQFCANGPSDLQACMAKMAACFGQKNERSTEKEKES